MAAMCVLRAFPDCNLDMFSQFFNGHQFMRQVKTKSFKIDRGDWVRGQHPQYCTGFDLQQRQLGAPNGLGAFQPFDVENGLLITQLKL